MTEKNLRQVIRYQPRVFVSDDADLTIPREAVALYHDLLKYPVDSEESFEQWVSYGSELSSVLDQQAALLYIAMTCQTDDFERARAYQDFIRDVVPAVKPLSYTVNRRFLELLEQFPVDQRRYRVLERNLRADVELFIDENIALETDVAILSQDYQTACGRMTVEFEGQERTLAGMGKYQFEQDRDLRESAWRLTAERWLEESSYFDTVFDKMFQLRQSIARNAGFDNFRDYQFKAYHRFDYAPEHCRQYHQMVEKHIVPVWLKILEKRREDLGLDVLRPWDLVVDVTGKPPLKPFETVDELVSGVAHIFNRIDSDIGKSFDDMAHLGLLDLENRRGKAPGGYQNTLAEARKPFIFMNAIGVDDDVRTLMHEGGHAYHATCCAHEPLLAYRHAPIEFCEVASMSMELLGEKFLDAFYDEQAQARSCRRHWESIIHILVWVAVVDSFQHQVYENPNLDLEGRNQAWADIHKRFFGEAVNWQGLDIYRRALWHRQLHIFEVPFYYIEYGIAQLGALQLYFRSQENWGETLADYKKALALGGSCTLPELFAEAGIIFDFSEKIIAPLAEKIVEVLGV